MSERRLIVEGIPYKTFKEKISITKSLKKYLRIEIFEKFVYVEREVYE